MLPVNNNHPSFRLLQQINDSITAYALSLIMTEHYPPSTKMGDYVSAILVIS